VQAEDRMLCTSVDVSGPQLGAIDEPVSGGDAKPSSAVDSNSSDFRQVAIEAGAGPPHSGGAPPRENRKEDSERPTQEATAIVSAWLGLPPAIPTQARASVTQTARTPTSLTLADGSSGPEDIDAARIQLPRTEVFSLQLASRAPNEAWRIEGQPAVDGTGAAKDNITSTLTKPIVRSLDLHPEANRSFLPSEQGPDKAQEGKASDSPPLSSTVPADSAAHPLPLARTTIATSAPLSTTSDEIHALLRTPQNSNPRTSRTISLDLPTLPEQGRTTVTFQQRGESLQLVLRTTQPEAAMQLRGDLPELAQRLETSGYRLEAVKTSESSTVMSTSAGSSADWPTSKQGGDESFTKSKEDGSYREHRGGGTSHQEDDEHDNPRRRR